MTPTEKEFVALFEERLKETLDADPSSGELGDACRYACFGGGKRVRPRLVYFGALAAGGDMPLDEVLDLSVAIELVHSYSLVHDDLPCMDDDDFRRGRPTVHKRFGEATAVLAGDALLTLAACVLAASGAKYGAKFSRAAAEITRGAYDMAKGQAADLRGAATEAEFLAMYSLKTGALIRACTVAGATVAGGDAECVAAVKEYAEALGLAFQLADDLLDLGEPDSFVAVAGEEKARAMLAKCTERAVRAAGRLSDGKILAEFAEALARRSK